MTLTFQYGAKTQWQTTCLHSAHVKIESKSGCSSTLNEPNDLQIESIESRKDNNTVKRHGRAILTDEQAQAIFKHKPTAYAQDRNKAGILARLYGVSVKTVRDIWVGRTWYRATFHMDHTKPFAPERLEKKAGRPKGSKDSKPRVRKTQSDGSHSDNLLEDTDDASCNTREQRQDAGLRHAFDRNHPVAAKDAAFTWGDLDGRSWTDFPMAIQSGGFEDPFREDWEFALQCNERFMESDSCGDWSEAIEDGQLFPPDDSASDQESAMI
uniref:Uncharacterized protein n=1 Tax=Cryptomonas curvata TaxID=233186 RepID=A0A7S0MI35_9CRYP